MLQNSPFNVSITNKYLSLSVLWGQDADSVILRKKNGSSCIFVSSGILPIPKVFIKVIKGLQTLLKSQFSKFRLSEGTTVYWKSKSSSSLTRNNSLELVLEHALRLALLYFWTFGLFDLYVLFYLPRVIQELWLKYVEKMPL